MKVLITGHDGYIGAVMSQFLLRLGDEAQASVHEVRLRLGDPLTDPLSTVPGHHEDALGVHRAGLIEHVDEVLALELSQLGFLPTTRLQARPSSKSANRLTTTSLEEWITFLAMGR